MKCNAAMISVRLFFLLIVLALLEMSQASAATYSLTPNNTPISTPSNAPALCSGNQGSWSGTTYVCNWGQPFSAASGDTITSTANIRILSYNGFNLNNVTLGTSSYTIDLEATGSNETRLTGSTLYGSIYGSSNNVRLMTGTLVNGSVSVTGNFESNNATITGSVNANNGITSTNTTFGSTLTANSSISLSGGSVAGQVWSTSNGVTTNGTNLNGGARSQSTMNITGGTVQGAFIFQSANPMTMSNVNFTSGSISGPSTANIINSTLGSSSSSLTVTVATNDINVTGSTVYANMTAPGTAKITDSTYTGNISVNTGKIELDNSVVTGNISSAGNDIEIKNGSTLTGNATAGTWNTVNVNDSSQVQGDCQPARVPPTACGSAPPVAQDSYWKFDEILWNDSSNEVLDSSTSLKHGRARNGAVTNTISPSPASCTYGDFQRGAGASNHPFVEITKNSYFHDSDEFSFAFWLKMSNSGQASGNQTIMAYGGPVSAADSSGRFQLTRLSGDILRFSIKMSDGNVRYVETTDASIFNGQWKHVAFSYSKNNKSMRLYVNAVLVDDVANDSIGNGNNARTPNDGTGNFSIGALPAGTEGIRGQIDEVRFYDKELTSGEVTTIKNLATACPGVGLVLGWDLNQGLWSGAANEVLDFSGNTLHGRTFNGVTSAFNGTKFSGDPGTCSFSQFDGINQYIETADNSLLDITDALTLSVWVKPTSLPATGGLMTVLSKDNNYEVHLQPDGKVQWWWNNSSGQARQLVSNAVLQTNVWTHIAVVYSSGNQTMYINGASNKTSTETGNLITNSSPLQLGADQGATGRYFHGALDELRVYRGALPLAQVQALATEVRSCNQCFTEDFTSITNWYASAYGSSTMPSRETNPQRLRLTTAETYQSTSMTIRKKFPAAGNKVSVEFNYYAWKPASGGGADGIAVTLSDATYTPAPGSFGGSLGYAQRTSPNDPGFNGGWLGIGLDEFGNFSNATEGRQGGPGARAQHVAIRGSWPNYNYLTGTTNALSPTLDIVGTNTPGRGHRYRITVDATTTTPTQRAYVKVERDTSGTGNSYTTIINDYDARGTAAVAAGQQTVPADFFLSFTGATGASVNYHEIATIQVCTVQPAPVVVITPPSAVHHYEISYGTQGLTCNPSEVTIKACSNADCSTLHGSSVSLTLAATNGASLVGGNTITLTGSTTKMLQKTTTGDTVLSITNPSATPSSALVCKQSSVTDDCSLNFADSGFVFDVQNMIANQSQNVLVRAVRKDNSSQQCAPGFANVTRAVKLWSDYIDPIATGRPESRSVLVNTQAIAKTFGTATTQNLAFNASGQATIALNYIDAGQMQLNARYDGSSGTSDNGLVMTGSDQFVSRPAGLCITEGDGVAAALSCASPYENCNAYKRAGENFSLSVIAKASANNGDTNLCANVSTPNFKADDIALSHTLLAPTLMQGGSAGSKAISEYDHVQATNGINTLTQMVTEAGVFSFSTPALSYLGTTVPAATSHGIGRFIPAYFTATTNTPVLAAGCGTFNYLGRELAYSTNPIATFTARNMLGTVTNNYGGAFFRAGALATAATTSNTLYSTTTSPASAVPGATRGTYSLAGQANYDGVFTLTLASDTVNFNRTIVPPYPAPFTPDLRLSSPATEVDDTDAVCIRSSAAGVCEDLLFSSMTIPQLRYGRFALLNASGPENENLPIVLQSQYWNGSIFTQNLDDNCSAFAPANLAVSGVTTLKGGTLGTMTSGQNLFNSMFIPATNTTGVATLQYQIPLQLQYMQFPWNGGTTLANPTAEAHFGRFRGNKRQIFWQERLN